MTLGLIGEHVTMEWQGRRLLGTVLSVSDSGVATVRHFNGELWPVQPTVSTLEWIRRDGTR